MSWKFQVTYVGHISEVILVCLDRAIWNQLIPVTVKGLKTRYETARDILTPFGVEVSAVDKHDTLPVLEDDLHILHELSLPQYAYEQIVDRIVDEIKHREVFVV